MRIFKNDWFIFFLIILGIVMISTTTVTNLIPSRCIEREAITFIGGCDRMGRCRVETENYFATTYYPIKGELICVQLINLYMENDYKISFDFWNHVDNGLKGEKTANEVRAK